MRRADRLIRIIHFIRGRKLAVTAQQIADELEVSTRTVYRDIQDLIANGTPIEGEAGIGYRIDKDYFLPPMTLSEAEIEAIGLGLSMVREWSDKNFADDAHKAFQKILAVLPVELQEQLDQITSFSMPQVNLSHERTDMTMIRTCIRHKQKLGLVYIDLQEKASTRTVWPLGLVYCGPVWLMVAWCELRQTFRSFRLDRIEETHPLAVFFEDHPERNLSAFRARDTVC